MAVSSLSDEQIESRLNVLERLIQTEKDEKNLPALNATLQRLLDEQVRRDLDREGK